MLAIILLFNVQTMVNLSINFKTKTKHFFFLKRKSSIKRTQYNKITQNNTIQYNTIGLECNIECKGYYACRYLKLQAHKSGNVSLIGIGTNMTDNRDIYYATINATTANGLIVTGYNTKSLYASSIYCPMQNGKNCHIYCNADFACYHSLFTFFCVHVYLYMFSFVFNLCFFFGCQKLRISVKQKNAHVNKKKKQKKRGFYFHFFCFFDTANVYTPNGVTSPGLNGQATYNCSTPNACLYLSWYCFSDKIYGCYFSTCTLSGNQCQCQSYGSCNNGLLLLFLCVFFILSAFLFFIVLFLEFARRKHNAWYAHHMHTQKIDRFFFFFFL